MVFLANCAGTSHINGVCDVGLGVFYFTTMVSILHWTDRVGTLVSYYVVVSSDRESLNIGISCAFFTKLTF